LTIEQIAAGIADVQRKSAPTIVMPSLVLKFAAVMLKVTGVGSAIGIHPDRVKKLMLSTNISGKKLQEASAVYKYSFQEALTDWYKDCDSKGLY
jgi:hypothetical protein